VTQFNSYASKTIKKKENKKKKTIFPTKMNFKNFLVLLLVALLVSAPVMANSKTLRSGS